jgi:hypothetical protein
MAIIFGNNSLLDSNTGQSLLLSDVTTNTLTYWGRLHEVPFLISYEELKRKRDSSPTGHVALKVRHLNNPAIVKLEWIKFDLGNQPNGNNTLNYYVIDSAGVDILTTLVGDGTVAIDARIAIKQNGDYCIYFHRTRIEHLGESGGGDGNGSGLRIPS